MANEILHIALSGQTLSAKVYYDVSGTITLRSNVGELTEEPEDSGVYKGTLTTIEAGDLVVITNAAGKVIGGGEYHPSVLVAVKTGFVLASNGLDNISTTEPSGLASNFREMIIQTWRRFFGKSTLSTTTLTCYKADGITAATTQAVSDDNSIQTQGEAS